MKKTLAGSFILIIVAISLATVSCRFIPATREIKKNPVEKLAIVSWNTETRVVVYSAVLPYSEAKKIHEFGPRAGTGDPKIFMEGTPEFEGAIRASAMRKLMEKGPEVEFRF